jgi:hypothetical protein
MNRKSAQITRLPTPDADATAAPRGPEPRDPEPAEAVAAKDSPATETGADAGMQVIEADVDGRRVRIVAKDEIVLECGQASVTLRRNGRIIIRGTYVETHSEGTNRIKGGQVRIN